jgi:hypothetical protein
MPSRPTMVRRLDGRGHLRRSFGPWFRTWRPGGRTATHVSLALSPCRLLRAAVAPEFVRAPDASRDVSSPQAVICGLMIRRRAGPAMAEPSWVLPSAAHAGALPERRVGRWRDAAATAVG